MDYRVHSRRDRKADLKYYVAIATSLVCAVGAFVACSAIITSKDEQPAVAQNINGKYYTRLYDESDNKLTGSLFIVDEEPKAVETSVTVKEGKIIDLNATVAPKSEKAAVEMSKIQLIFAESATMNNIPEIVVKTNADIETIKGVDDNEIEGVNDSAVADVADSETTEPADDSEPVENAVFATAEPQTEEQTIYQYENLYLDITDVRKPSNMTLAQLQKWTKRFAPNWVGLEPAILEYDKQINLVFLLAVARAETCAGAVDGMVGNYNCFNIKGKGGGYVDYNSYLESIDDFVNLLNHSYLSTDGMYFEGYGIKDIQIHYAGSHWGPGIITLADELIWHFEAGSLSK